MTRPTPPRGLAGQDLFTEFEFGPDRSSGTDDSRDIRIAHVRELLARRSPQAAALAIITDTTGAKLTAVAMPRPA